MQQELGSDARMTMLDVSGVSGEAVETKTSTIVEKVSLGRNYWDLTMKSMAFGGNFEGEYLPSVNEMVLE